jgi:sugar phosphate isomerase/epimerase
MGIWRGQATLTVDEFLLKAKELGFDGVMLAAKMCFTDHIAKLKKAYAETINSMRKL